MRSQRAVSCPVVELPNTLFITQPSCGDLLKERLWVFLSTKALILGRQDGGALLLRHISLFRTLQVDAIATSVNAHGVFAEVGPLSVFVSNHVCLPLSFVFFQPLACTDIYEIKGDLLSLSLSDLLSLSLSSSYRQISNGTPTPLLLNTPIIRIKLSKKVPICASN